MARPTAVDLFCGVGGLSLGASRAGFDVILGVDNDCKALGMHGTNFPNCCSQNNDLSKATAAELRYVSDCCGKPFDKVDLVMGGSPCPGFSRIGLKKADDPRNNLFFHFFRLVSEFAPVAFLAENVEGILDEAHKPVIEKALSQVEGSYDLLPPLTIRASDYGAPTTRTRVFFIGIIKGIVNPLDLLEDFNRQRAIALGHHLNVGDALTGLPTTVDPQWRNKDQDWQPIQSFSTDPCFMRHTGYTMWKFYSVFGDAKMHGYGDPAAIDRLAAGCASGFLGTRHTPEVIKRFAATPPGKTEKISRFPRLDANGLCPTLRAGTGSDHGSYQSVRPIHPTEDRVITVREGARLQGFPDWFRFSADKWGGFRQIGNSVCPPVAEALLTCVANCLVGNLASRE